MSSVACPFPSCLPHPCILLPAPASTSRSPRPHAPVRPMPPTRFPPDLHPAQHPHTYTPPLISRRPHCSECATHDRRVRRAHANARTRRATDHDRSGSTAIARRSIPIDSAARSCSSTRRPPISFGPRRPPPRIHPSTASPRTPPHPRQQWPTRRSPTRRSSGPRSASSPTPVRPAALLASPARTLPLPPRAPRPDARAARLFVRRSQTRA